METMTTGIQPYYNVNGDNGFENGGWFWIIILLLFGNNGWGNRNNCDMNENFIMRDIFNTNQNVSNTAATTQNQVLSAKYDTAMATMENRYATQLGFANAQAQQAQCCCDTKKEILQNRYDNQIQTNVLQAQANANMQRILDGQNAMMNMWQQDKIDSLRESLFTATQAYNNQLLANNIVSQLQPVAKPAYLTTSPYASYPVGCGCNCNCNQ